MKRIINLIRSFQPRNLLIVLLASSLLIFGTACNQGPATASDKTVGEEITAKSDRGYDSLDARDSAKGGMNNYNDDVRYDQPLKSTGKTPNEKAKTLINQAKSQVNSQDNPAEFAEGVGERAGKSLKQAQKEIPQKLGERKDELVNATQDKASNLKGKLENLPEKASRSLDEAGDRVQKTQAELSN
ncbi:hypothetical protein [Myxosarcina sp. GI1]|uniref:hypothetical protein n=1 Tax=Myxosarcina sp. GI1 TaxID=1541065 RepID=UPI00055FB294|nr:hypothetical protein [Myxosarcina sp. GI1]